MHVSKRGAYLCGTASSKHESANMKTLSFLLALISARTALCCVVPVVSTEYNFMTNVSQISGSLGSFIRVECTANPTTDVTSYVWQKDRVNVQEPSLLSLFLTIRSLAVEDGGQYRCEVTTTSCGTRYSPEISINTPPDTAVIAGPSSVPEGHAFQLSCSANGWPPPSYEWRFDGGTSIATGSVYAVSSASLTDSGEYTCIAQNSRGQVQTAVSLTVFTVTTQAVSTTPSLAPSQATVPVSDEPPPPSMSGTTSSSRATTLKTRYTAVPTPSQVTKGSTPQPPTQTTSLPSSPERTAALPTKGSTSVQRGLSVTPTTGGVSTSTSSVPSSESDLPTAPFIVLLAISVALLVALLGVIITVFVLVVYMMATPPRRRKGDRERLLVEEKEAGEGMEMTDGVIRDPEKLSTHVPEKPPMSYVNIAFGRDSGREEEEDEDGEIEIGGVDLGSGTDGSAVKVSPQRYQPHSSKPESPSKKQLPLSKLPHSISMDGPKPQGKRVARVPHSRSMGDPGQLRVDSHLTPPVDRHRVGHKRENKTGGKTKQFRSSEPCKSERPCTKNLTDTDTVQLLAAMEEYTEQTEVSNATVLTTVSSDENTTQGEEERENIVPPLHDEERESSVRGEGGERDGERKEEEQDRREETEGEGGGECDREEVKEEGEYKHRDENVETTLIDEVDEELEGETVETEAAVVIQAKLGEASITFEQEGNTSGLLDEGSGAVLSSVLLSSGEEEGGGVEVVEVGAGEGGKVGEEEVLKVGILREDGATGGVEDKIDGEPDIHRMSVFIEKARRMGRPVSFIAQLERSNPLTVADIQGLVEEAMARQKVNTLTLEYRTVPHNSIQTLPLSTEEKHKNRYRNVLPNPHSAVRLSDTGATGSQYINANYIRGYGDKERQYIATQGPTSHTVPDFWRMVWEKGVSIIVMTTPLVEKGQQKCVKYWPSADDVDTAVYGYIVVRNNYEEVNEFYTTSYLTVSLQSPDGGEIGEERDVYHFWYTAWTDFSVPKETGSILKLREAVDAFRIPSSGPVVVHCSAGLGRSGTFMGIDMGIQQYEEEGVVDPLKYLCEMRQDRGGIIQTADQYIYIHRALRDYITS